MTAHLRYSDLTRQYFERAPFAGELTGEGIGRGSAGTVDEGIWVRFDVECAAATIRQARFAAFGCPHTVAVCAWVAEQAPGGRVAEALPETPDALQRRFEVPREKMGRLLVIEDAWIAAIRQGVTKLGNLALYTMSQSPKD